MSKEKPSTKPTYTGLDALNSTELATRVEQTLAHLKAARTYGQALCI